MMMEMLTTKHVLSPRLKNFPRVYIDLSINNSPSENENKEENDRKKVRRMVIRRPARNV